MDRGSICGRTGVVWWGGWHGRCWPRLPKTPCGYVKICDFNYFPLFICKPGCFCWGLHTFWSAKYSAMTADFAGHFHDLTQPMDRPMVGFWSPMFPGFWTIKWRGVWLVNHSCWFLLQKTELQDTLQLQPWYYVLRVNDSWWRGCHGRWDIYI